MKIINQKYWHKRAAQLEQIDCLEAKRKALLSIARDRLDWIKFVTKLEYTDGLAERLRAHLTEDDLAKSSPKKRGRPNLEHPPTTSEASRVRKQLWHNKRRMERYKSDPQYRLRAALRSRFQKVLKRDGVKKQQSAIDLVGCTIPELKAHLERSFRDGMSWENHGTHWHIDHIIPCARFDLAIPHERARCFHFTNLQPISKWDNLSKGARVMAVGQMSLGV